MTIKGNALAGIRCDVGWPRDYHFLTSRCDDCDVRILGDKPLEMVEGLYHSGHVRQAMYEAYRHVWATSAVRYGNGDGWSEPPTDPEVIALAELFRKNIAEREAARAAVRPQQLPLPVPTGAANSPYGLERAE